MKSLGNRTFKVGGGFVKVASLALLFLVPASRALTQSQEITGKPDSALGVTVFAPKKIPSVNVNQGLLKMDRITWRVYPVVYQKLDKAEKQAAMVIDIIGPMNGGFTNAPLIFNIDGQVSTIPVTWKNLTTLFGNADVSAMIGLRDVTFRRIAGAREVFLTVLLEGRTDRYTLHLTVENLAIFRTMLGEYDELEPKQDTSK